MNNHQKKASAEISRLSEIVQLYQNVSYMKAQGIVLRKHPELLKQYIQEISPDTL